MTAKVYIVGPHYRSLTIEAFMSQGDRYEITEDLPSSDLVVFTGGADINPALYGEKAIPGTYYTDNRDRMELEALHKAHGMKKFLVGICRGAQLLNVIPNGGRLWQDVDGHESRIHKCFDEFSQSWVNLNSVHHQQMRVTNKAEVLCWTAQSSKKFSENDKWVSSEKSPRDKDVEVAFYEDTRSFCFQGHPEFGSAQTTAYFFKLLDRLYWKV